MNNQERKVYYRDWDLFQRKQEIYWLPKIFKVLQANNRAFADYLLQNGVNSALANIDSIVKIDGIYSLLQRLYVEVGLKRARYINRAIKAEEQKAAVLGFNEQMTRDIQRYFELYILNKSVIPITATEKEYIRSVLAKGAEEGLGVEQMAKLITSSPYTRKHARVVVRTESVRASNAAADLAASRSEYVMDKEWISARDSRVRRPPKSKFDHWDLHGQVVPGYRPFFSGGEELQFPGDPNGSAGNVIQCRCTVAYQPRRVDDKLVKKPTQTTLILPGTSQISQVITIGIQEAFR